MTLSKVANYNHKEYITKKEKYLKNDFQPHKKKVETRIPEKYLSAVYAIAERPFTKEKNYLSPFKIVFVKYYLE